MNALKPKPPFQVLVMSEESRLGRESIETAYTLKQLVTSGVRVFFYLEDRERTLDSPTDKIMLSLTAYADELEREKARQRTYDAMRRKAKAGHVTGGRVFGYDNVPVSVPGSDGTPRRSHTERRINDDEAAVVRRIFELCAQGRGLTATAKQLNEERACCPRAQQGRPRGWAPSSVREVLHRPLYRGEIVWNRSRKRNLWGQAKPSARPAAEWLCVPAPQLRIVPETLWQAAHERIDTARVSYLRGTDGKLWGRPARGTESKYLLPGLARCGCCGGSLYVKSRSHGKRRKFFYGCTSFHLRGRVVCTNSAETPMEATDKAVLAAVTRDLLQPDVLHDVITRTVAALRPDDADLAAQRRDVDAKLTAVTNELERLSAAIAIGGDLEALVAAVKDRETLKASLTRDRAALERTARLGPAELGRLEAEARARLEDWQGLLSRHVTQARQILRKLLTGHLIFTPKGSGRDRYYEFEGEGTLGKLLSGLSANMVASPRATDTSRSPIFSIGLDFDGAVKLAA